MAADRSPPEAVSETRATTDVAGLDEILCGGFTRNRLNLLEGMPGSGKTTLALQFLQAGVATLLIGAHQGLIGGPMIAPVDASYLADAVILLRYFEMKGEVRQAISGVNKRGGAHERTIREFRMDAGRISIGQPLRDFRGVLTGVPIHEAASAPSKEGGTT